MRLLNKKFRNDSQFWFFVVADLFLISLCWGWFTHVFLDFNPTSSTLTELSSTISIAVITILSFISIFLVFRLQILTENKRNAGYRLRRFSKDLEEKLSTVEYNNLSKIEKELKCNVARKKYEENEELNTKINELEESIENIIKKSKKLTKNTYEGLMKRYDHRSYSEVISRFENVINEGKKIGKLFRTSFAFGISLIIFSLSLSAYGDNSNFNTLWISIYISLELILTIAYIYIIIYYIRHKVLENWIFKKNSN